MLLAIDVGNTNITLGLYEDDKLGPRWRLATDHERMPDEYGLQFVGLLAHEKLLVGAKGANVLFNDSHVEFVVLHKLAELDVRRTQILVKTQILTATDEFLKDIGLDANSVRTSELWSEHLLADSVAEPNSTPYRLILDDLSVSFLLRAVQAHKGAKMVAAPQVMAMNGRESMMKMVRGEYFIPTPSDPNDPSRKAKPKPESIEVGTSVRFTPNVMTGNDNVSLDFEWELRQVQGFKERVGPDKKKRKFPSIAVDSIKTTAMVPDGKTLLICGTKFTEYKKSGWSVPVLSDLPGVGGAFRSSRIEGEPKTLLIL